MKMEGGGYDVEPIDALQEDFYCIVCTVLIKEAMQMQCGHVLCKGCLETLEDTSRKKYISLLIAFLTMCYNIDYAYLVITYKFSYRRLDFHPIFQVP